MSSTTPISPLQRADDVASYVAAVRARLDDLAPDEVEELTGGLEADLAEALAGGEDSPRERFGDPVAYADELRAAADLPPRREPADDQAGTLAAAWRDVSAVMDAQLDAVKRLPSYEPVRDFLVVLRPAWWVLRAWIAVAVLRLFLNANETGIIGEFPAFVVLVLAIVGSVTLGRRTPLRTPLARTALLLGNVIAVLAFFPTIGQFAEPPRGGEVWEQPGLWNNGNPVQDVVPYDSQGRPLTGVALYDENGQPLELGYYAGQDVGGYSGTSPLPGNVFPKYPAGQQPEATESDPDPDQDEGAAATQDPGDPGTATRAPATTATATPAASATASPSATVPAATATTPVATPTR